MVVDFLFRGGADEREEVGRKDAFQGAGAFWTLRWRDILEVAGCLAQDWREKTEKNQKRGKEGFERENERENRKRERASFEAREQEKNLESSGAYFCRGKRGGTIA